MQSKATAAVLVIVTALAQLALSSGPCHGARVEIWDEDMPGWTTTLIRGDSIYQGPIIPPNDWTQNRGSSIATDSNGIVYAAYCQGGHIYFSKYDGRDVRTWDSVNLAWQAELPVFAPIDFGWNAASNPMLDIDSRGVVYIAYEKEFGGVYLHRYDGVDLRIWDNDAACWTLDLQDGDRIDTGLAVASIGDIEIDSRGCVYVVYTHRWGMWDVRAYLSRYNGRDVRIWDGDTSSWTTAFWKGDPIDKGGGIARSPEMASDSKSALYITYTQDDRLYLNRYNGVDMRIWDSDTASWVLDLQAGDPIDTGAAPALDPHIAVYTSTIDLTTNVYLAYLEEDPDQGKHLYLSRYNGKDVRIWDHDTLSWTTAFWKGDRIDKAEGCTWSSAMAIDRNGVLYLTFVEEDTRDPNRDVDIHRIYLDRYNGRDVRMWNRDTSSWTTNLEKGTPIDIGNDKVVADTWSPDIAIDSNGFVYVAYAADTNPRFADNYHIYLSRYNGLNVTAWDNDTSSWTPALDRGDRIDRGGDSALSAGLAAAPRGFVYCMYRYWEGNNLLPWLSRYNPNPL
jgi:hypothetical protein